MQLIRLIAELFVIYILYKLVFEFILPLYSASKQMNRKMQEFQQKSQSKQSGEPRHEEEQRTETRPVSNDYIDFEEIKS